MAQERMSVAEYKAKMGRIKDIYAEPKYHNKKTVIDGRVFDSQLEGNRYLQLKMLWRAGEISWFNVQPSFCLPGGVRIRPDFIVCDLDGRIWLEDTKGRATREWLNKYKAFQAAYPGFELRIIEEV